MEQKLPIVGILFFYQLLSHLCVPPLVILTAIFVPQFTRSHQKKRGKEKEKKKKWK